MTEGLRWRRALLPCGLASAVAQQDTGPLPQTQAAQGHTDYSSACASCHQENLSGGGEAPSLAGGNFIKSWGNRSTRELYDYLHSAMPLGKGGSLSDQTYQNIVAFLLEANGATAGGKPFSSDTEVKIGNVANGQPPGGLALRARAITTRFAPASLSRGRYRRTRRSPTRCSIIPRMATGLCSGAITRVGASARSSRSMQVMSKICSSNGPGR